MDIRHALTTLASRSAVLIGGLLVGGLVFAGCDSITNFEEINKNPNNPAEVASSQQISGLLGNFSYEVIGNEAARTPSHWIQQIAFNADPPHFGTYQYTETNPNNLWEFFLFSGSMIDARKTRESALEEGNFANAGIAQVIEAWSWMIAADLWDDIPVEEAFQDDILNPAYSNQEVAYDSVFVLLQSARQNFDRGNDTPIRNNDLLYGGDLTKWESLAWALEAKAHIHLTESGYSVGLDGGSSRSDRAQAALDAATQAFPNGNADNAAFVYPGGDDAENPWYQYTIQGGWDLEHQLSAQYVARLKRQQDPRLGIQARQVGAITEEANGVDEEFAPVDFDPSVHFDYDDDTYVGHPNGADGVTVDNVSSIGKYYGAEDTPLIWMNYAEVKFIEAEARLITGQGSARDAYEDGIRASLSQLDVTSLANVDGAFVDAFVDDQLAEYDNLSDKLRVIIEEKYIANFLRIEPFNDWRRTGYPDLDPVPANVAETPNDEIPRRYPYPNSEYTDNAENVPTDVGRGVNALPEPVGWDPMSQ